MGLDMYLHRKVYVKNWNHEPSKKKVEVKFMKEGETTFKKHPLFKGREANVSTIVEDVMYWRKANSIHRWFIDNTAEGVDDCRPVYVEFEQLEELLEHVKEVLKNPENAEAVLPTQGGFFFGSTEYGDWYMDDMKQTKEGLEKIIKEHKDAVEAGVPLYDISYEYQASW